MPFIHCYLNNKDNLKFEEDGVKLHLWIFN